MGKGAWAGKGDQGMTRVGASSELPSTEAIRGILRRNIQCKSSGMRELTSDPARGQCARWGGWIEAGVVRAGGVREAPGAVSGFKSVEEERGREL